jgi:hypothetical protein
MLDDGLMFFELRYLMYVRLGFHFAKSQIMICLVLLTFLRCFCFVYVVWSLSPVAMASAAKSCAYLGSYYA